MAVEPQDVGARYFGSLGGAMLVAGCERVPLAIVAGIGIGPIYIGLNALFQGIWLAAAIASLIGATTLIVGIHFLRRIAKRDPLGTRIYLKARKRRRFYPARSTPWCK